MKKILALVLALCLVFALCACGTQKAEEPTEEPTAAEPTAETEKTEEPTEPAEETEGGAERMVKAGVMENPHVDRVYGLHVMPRLPVGTVETRRGTLNASTDSVTLIVHGLSGHGAYPESGRDAIVCAAQIISPSSIKRA